VWPCYKSPFQEHTSSRCVTSRKGAEDLFLVLHAGELGCGEGCAGEGLVEQEERIAHPSARVGGDWQQNGSESPKLCQVPPSRHSLTLPQHLLCTFG
jgi:hypothetical protein